MDTAAAELLIKHLEHAVRESYKMTVEVQMVIANLLHDNANLQYANKELRDDNEYLRYFITANGLKIPGKK
jgi:regulator of replication initiation timing